MQSIIEFIAGLGMFLYAMHLLEAALKNLAGRTFKLFLRKHTNNTLEAVTSSAIITGLLQSSSVVIMTILAFVGAGIVSMRNAMAVSIGSHFGTTLDSWLVASVGFKLDVSIIALPLVAVACITLGFTSGDRKIHQVAKLLLGFGLLFLGLEYMKNGMSVLLEDFDFTKYQGYPRIVFVLIGFMITSLIQSSSATMAILLSALYTNAIPFETAVTAVIGSEFGATTKVMIGGLTGIAAKRQLAVGNIAFNLFICSIAFIFQDFLARMTGVVLNENEILLRLVLFQSSINLIGVLVFAPLLNPITHLLEKYVHGKEDPATFVIGNKLLRTPQIAMDAFEQDAELLLHRVLRLNPEAFASTRQIIHSPRDINTTLTERNRKLKTYEARYADLKKSEGEMLAYALKLSDTIPEEKSRIDTLIMAIRHAMHSAKAMKDVYHDRVEFHESADDAKFRQYINFRNHLEDFYREINNYLKMPAPSFAGLVEMAHEHYRDRRNAIYEAASKEKLQPEDLSSLMNVNRELYTSCKTIVQALQLFHKSAGSAQIGEIP